MKNIQRTANGVVFRASNDGGGQSTYGPWRMEWSSGRGRRLKKTAMCGAVVVEWEWEWEWLASANTSLGGVSATDRPTQL